MRPNDMIFAWHIFDAVLDHLGGPIDTELADSGNTAINRFAHAYGLDHLVLGQSSMNC